MVVRTFEYLYWSAYDVHWWMVSSSWNSGIRCMLRWLWRLVPGKERIFPCCIPSHVLNHNLNINQLELLAVMVCVKLWNTHLFKKNIFIKCDNQSVVIVLNSGSTRDLFMQTCSFWNKSSSFSWSWK